MNLCVPCYCDACFKCTALRVGVKTSNSKLCIEQPRSLVPYQLLYVFAAECILSVWHRDRQPTARWPYPARQQNHSARSPLQIVVTL